MNTRILVVDDEPLIAQDLKFLLLDMGISEVEVAMSYDEALIRIQTEHFDLALLDIQLGGPQDGVALAEHAAQQEIPFIFLTSYYTPEVVARAKQTKPNAYLLKPFKKAEIQINVEMALFKERQAASGEVFIREKNGMLKVDLSQLLFLEAEDSYTRMVFSDEEKLVSQTLKTLHKKLAEHNLIRVHKSYCVKVDAISMIKGNSVVIEEHNVPIGRAYKSDFLKAVRLL